MSTWTWGGEDWGQDGEEEDEENQFVVKSHISTFYFVKQLTQSLGFSQTES